MQCSSVSQRLGRWFGALGVLILLSGSSLGQVDIQDWLDSLTELVQSYDDLTIRVACDAESERNELVSNDTTNFDHPRADAYTDCLASRLLAEEYQPYDFDIRETFWCKGWTGSCDDLLNRSRLQATSDATFSEASEENFTTSLSLGLVPARPWIHTIWSCVWSGFSTRMKTDWDFVSHQATNMAVYVQEVAVKIDRQFIDNRVARIPSLRETFGSSVMPNEISVTSEEYAVLAIQLWNEIQSKAEENGILMQSTWYRLRSSNLEPLYDLVTLIPNLFPMTQR